MATEQMERGTVAHALLLGKGRKLQIIDADDYRGGAARGLRGAGVGELLALDFDHVISTSPRLRASAGAGNGSGCRTTTGTLSTDAQRRREKERLMGGIL